MAEEFHSADKMFNVKHSTSDFISVIFYWKIFCLSVTQNRKSIIITIIIINGHKIKFVITIKKNNYIVIILKECRRKYGNKITTQKLMLLF